MFLFKLVDLAIRPLGQKRGEQAMVIYFVFVLFAKLNIFTIKKTNFKTSSENKEVTKIVYEIHEVTYCTLLLLIS